MGVLSIPLPLFDVQRTLDKPVMTNVQIRTKAEVWLIV
jgi:hypothetical protein